MVTGYTFILCAALCWGVSATWARHLILTEQADALLLSQSRVFFAWVFLALGLVIFQRQAFAVVPRALLSFAVLGVGMAGANYFLYKAIGEMNAALADLIQFTAPILVVVWMWVRQLEPLGKYKVIALVLSLIGCAGALGVTDLKIKAPGGALASAFASAVCFASVLILGKAVSANYNVFTYLNYALLGATLFWFFITPPWSMADRIGNWNSLILLFSFGVTSILVPYLFFFAGL